MDRAGLIRELESRGVLGDANVRRAFREVDRAMFVPSDQREFAYENRPLPIGEGQTISQPLTVAIMTEALDVGAGHKVLEVGTGSGYQAAIISKIIGASGRLVTIEARKSLADFARGNLSNFDNIEIVDGDGCMGYVARAPYDRIIVTASASKVPNVLVSQLREGGIMVLPIKDRVYRIVKRKTGLGIRSLGCFLFVPLKED